MLVYQRVPEMWPWCQWRSSPEAPLFRGHDLREGRRTLRRVLVTTWNGFVWQVASSNQTSQWKSSINGWFSSKPCLITVFFGKTPESHAWKPDCPHFRIAKYGWFLRSICLRWYFDSVSHFKVSFLLIKSSKSPCLLVIYRKLHSIIHSYSYYDQENPMVTCRIWVGETALVEHHGGGGKLTSVTPATYVKICWLNVNPWKKPQAVKLWSTTALVFMVNMVYYVLAILQIMIYWCAIFIYGLRLFGKKNMSGECTDSSLAFKPQRRCAWQMASTPLAAAPTNYPERSHIPV
jgi:hypothetical protein